MKTIQVTFFAPEIRDTIKKDNGGSDGNFLLAKHNKGRLKKAAMSEAKKRIEAKYIAGAQLALNNVAKNKRALERMAKYS